MSDECITLKLSDEAATVDFAARISGLLKIGDTLLLEGPIGSGKSTFARACIQQRLGRAEDVPSPTFTLVQTYHHDRGDIWHCDLYRLTHPDEALELGLDEAFETAICLIEWPDRLGDTVPDGCLLLRFLAEKDGHSITICAEDHWRYRLSEFYD